MASLTSSGSVLHGIGGGQASIDNVPFSAGAAFGWVDDRTACFADGTTPDWTVRLYDVVTTDRRPAVSDPRDPQYGVGANSGAAGGGVWAAWLSGGSAQRGLFSSTGFRRPNAGLLAVGPDGTIGYKPSYQSDGPSVAHEVSGAEWTLTEGHASDLMLLGEGRAIWQERQKIVVHGLPRPLQVGAAWRPQAFLISGAWWVAYYSSEWGIILHPVDQLLGYVLVPLGVDCWHSGRLLANGVLRFALASAEGEQPGQVRVQDVDFTRPRRSLRPDDPVPPQPAPPQVTIADYHPTSGLVPLAVTATAAFAPGSGPIDTLYWETRRAVDTEWGIVAANLPSDLDHTYHFTAAGLFEIRLRAVGAGGDDATAPGRVVASAAPPPPQPFPMFPPAVPYPQSPA